MIRALAFAILLAGCAPGGPAMTEPLLSKGAIGLFPKGQDLAKELTEAAKCWKIKALELPSLTDPKARILRVEMAERLSDAQNDRD